MEIDMEFSSNLFMDPEALNPNQLSLSMNPDDYNELVKAYNDSIDNPQKFQANLYQLKRKFLRNQESSREQRKSISQNQKVIKKQDHNQSPQPFKSLKNAKHAFNSKVQKGKQSLQIKPNEQKPSLRNILRNTNFQENQKIQKEMLSSQHQQLQFEQIEHIPGNNENLDQAIVPYNELQEIPEDMQTLEMYSIGKLLGSGATAEVKLAKHKVLDIPIAMKIYDRKKMSAQAHKNLAREIDILKKMNHPNIIKLYHVIENQKQYYLAMEYTSPTCLETYMRGKPYKRVTEDEGKLIFRQIVDAIAYLHSLNILHRDMKLENLLIDYQTKKVKLIDFGYSVVIDPQVSAQISCGTPSYMAPEIIKKAGYSFGADVWACGIILYKLITGVFPFRGNSEVDLFKKITGGKVEFPSFVSQNVKVLICQMLKTDQFSRVTIDEVKQNQWLY